MFAFPRYLPSLNGRKLLNYIVNYNSKILSVLTQIDLIIEITGLFYRFESTTRSYANRRYVAHT